MPIPLRDLLPESELNQIRALSGRLKALGVEMIIRHEGAVAGWKPQPNEAAATPRIPWSEQQFLASEEYANLSPAVKTMYAEAAEEFSAAIRESAQEMHDRGIAYWEFMTLPEGSFDTPIAESAQAEMEKNLRDLGCERITLLRDREGRTCALRGEKPVFKTNTSTASGSVQ
jgi:hypothetical protein